MNESLRMSQAVRVQPSSPRGSGIWKAAAEAYRSIGVARSAILCIDRESPIDSWSACCLAKVCHISRMLCFSETKFISSDGVTYVDASHTFSGSS